MGSGISCIKFNKNTAIISGMKVPPSKENYKPKDSNKSEFPSNERINIVNINKIKQQLSEKEEEIKKMEDENKRLKNDHLKTENDNNVLKKDIKTFKDEINKIKDKNKNLEDEIKRIEDENKKLNKFLEKLNKDNENQKNELNIKLHEIEKSKLEIEKLKHELNNQKIEKDLEKEINLLKTKQKIFEQEKEQYEIKINELVLKEKSIKNKENQLNIRENKIIQKENELIQREKNISEIEKKYKIVLIGLNNIGATCYMNATLQCLSNTKKLTEYFLNTYKKDSNKIMTNEYYEVIKNLWDVDSAYKSYSPNSFKNVLSKENPLFAGIAANDSKDLINFLLERFHQELNVINQKNNINNNDNFNQVEQTNEFAVLKEFLEEYSQKFNSPISHLFYGILETKSQCQGCNVIKYNFQVYNFLEFPLQQVNQYYFNLGKRPLITNEGKNPDVGLYECFEYNRKIDLMAGDNQMYCNICDKLCNNYYSTLLYSGPNYLIINLNRGKGAVYECRVNFPEQLNIFNFVSFKDGITVYELYAVICHLGPSSMEGHFVAYCKNRIDNQWYLYNDAFVTKCTRQFQYNDGMPYILFYRALTSS